MNTVRIGFLCCLALLVASCSNLKALTQKPIVKDVLGRLVDAIQDIDPAGLGKEQLCGQYKRKGVVLAEAAWANEWPKFAPLWNTAVDPAADKLYCENLIRQAGATIVTKRSDSGAASAVCFQAQFPQDFSSKPLGMQAAIACHEAAHIWEQRRVGCGEWLALYFGTISARLTFEGTAYALMRKLLVRYGWTPAQAQTEIAKRALRFPETYSIPREVITDTCTMEHWDAIYAALQERTAV